MKLGLVFSAPVQVRLISWALLAGVAPSAYGEMTLLEWTARVRDRRRS